MQMRIFRRRILPAFVLLLLLGGCSSTVIGPSKIGSSNHIEFQDDGKDKLVGDAAIALYKEGTTGIVVGWEHAFQAGNNSSDQIYNRIYRGAVKFDMDAVRKSRARTIARATLTYAIHSGARSSSKRPVAESCVTKLLIAQEDWHGAPEMDIAKAPDTIHGDPYRDDLPEKPLGSVIRIDVTDVVKAWATDTRPNHGFVFAGSKEEKGLIKDSEKCWTLLSGFALRLNYSN